MALAETPAKRLILLHRRALLASALAGAGSVLFPRPSRAQVWNTAFDWFIKLVEHAAPSVDDIYLALLKIKDRATILINDKARMERVRRQLTDPSSGQELQTKLEVWLKRYQAFASGRPKAGESDQEFSARKERERVVLESDWKRLRKDAIDALDSIRAMGEELESLTPVMGGEEWRRYKELLRNEREHAMFLDIDMPTDPILLDRLQETAANLKKVVQTINKYAAELEEAIRREKSKDNADPNRRT